MVLSETILLGVIYTNSHGCFIVEQDQCQCSEFTLFGCLTNVALL